MPYVIGTTRAGLWTWVYVDRDEDGDVGVLRAVTNFRTKSYESCRQRVMATATAIRDYQAGTAMPSPRGYRWHLVSGQESIDSAHVFATREQAGEECDGMLWLMSTPRIVTDGVRQELWMNPTLAAWDWNV